MTFKSASIACALLAWFGHGTPVDADGTAGFTTIAQGDRSGITSDRQFAIRDGEAWKAFWLAHAGPSEPLPPVDFRSEMVVVVHLGTRPTGGYAARITRIDRESGALTVHYDEQKPGAGCLVPQVLTQPHHIVTMPKTRADPVFVKHERIEDCAADHSPPALLTVS